MKGSRRQSKVAPTQRPGKTKVPGVPCSFPTVAEEEQEEQANELNSCHVGDDLFEFVDQYL